MSDSANDLDAATLDDLSDEFLARLRRGESPTLDEYSRRHPHLADAIVMESALSGFLEPSLQNGREGNNACAQSQKWVQANATSATMQKWLCLSKKLSF